MCYYEKKKLRKNGREKRRASNWNPRGANDFAPICDSGLWCLLCCTTARSFAFVGRLAIDNDPIRAEWHVFEAGKRRCQVEIGTGVDVLAPIDAQKLFQYVFQLEFESKVGFIAVDALIELQYRRCGGI